MSLSLVNALLVLLVASMGGTTSVGDGAATETDGAATETDGAATETYARPERADDPRRPARHRPEPPLSFPETTLPSSSLRPRRGETTALDAYLGPIPKEVVVAEGTSLAAMRRVIAVPNTALGFATVGGNTLTPEDVHRLGRLPSVHLYLTAPIEPVHIEVLERVSAVGSTTVTLPPDREPGADLAWRMARLGPGRRHIVLRGAMTPSRLLPLEGARLSSITIDLPQEGIDEPLAAALTRLRAPLRVRLPSDASPAALETLDGRDIETIILETDGNRLRPEVVEAAGALASRMMVVVDRRVTREDLRRLKRVPRLGLLVWLADEPDVPRALTDLLLESEGVRSRPGD